MDMNFANCYKGSVTQHVIMKKQSSFKNLTKIYGEQIKIHKNIEKITIFTAYLIFTSAFQNIGSFIV